MFTDYKDGRSYALYSNGDRREGRDVYLTSYNKEVSALDKVVHRFDKYDLEAPTILQTDKSYYALMSHKTGYRPNSKIARLFSLNCHGGISDQLMKAPPRCCGIPSGQAERTLVAALGSGSPKHPDIQFSIRFHPENRGQAEDHVPVPRRSGKDSFF